MIVPKSLLGRGESCFKIHRSAHPNNMRTLFLLALASIFWIPLQAQQPDEDYSHIDVIVTPFYSNQGPSIEVGHFSLGLSSPKEKEFLTTIASMKGAWDKLTFPELYVAAIRLYDLGYRKEAVYWYYTAQYRGRLFSALLDKKKKGGIGSEAFELSCANNAFFELVGPYISGYAYQDTDELINIIKKVKESEQARTTDFKAIYPRVHFIKKEDWKAANDKLANGMDGLISMIEEKKEEIKSQRIEAGIEEKIRKLVNKSLPEE